MREKDLVMIVLVLAILYLLYKLFGEDDTVKNSGVLKIMPQEKGPTFFNNDSNNQLYRSKTTRVDSNEIRNSDNTYYNDNTTYVAKQLADSKNCPDKNEKNIKVKFVPNEEFSTTSEYNANDIGDYTLGINPSDKGNVKYRVPAPNKPEKINAKDYLPNPNERIDEWWDTYEPIENIEDAELLMHGDRKVGIDTQGNTLKNPSYDLRGTIANPKFQVSPFLNSSYDADINIKELCSNPNK